MPFCAVVCPSRTIAARGTVIDVLCDGVVAQSGIAQPGGKALVAAMSDLAVDQQSEPIGMGNATCQVTFFLSVN
jgi:hypothetical protein